MGWNCYYFSSPSHDNQLTSLATTVAAGVKSVHWKQCSSTQSPHRDHIVYFLC
jgi:hypothetical protein